MQSEATSVETVELVPTYSNCETLLGAAVTVATNECKYVFHLATASTTGPIDVECPVGKSIEISVGTLCKYTIGTQTGLNSVSYKNTGSGVTREVTVEPNVTGVTVTRTTNHFFCPAGSSEGTYTGSSTLTGQNSEGGHVGIFVD